MKAYVENAKVERIFDTQNGSTGVAVVEEREVRGEMYRLWVTLWFKRRPEVHVGDRVNASGFVSAKAREYESGGERKLAADISLNGAEIQSVQPGADAVPVEVDPWAGDTSWA